VQLKESSLIEAEIISNMFFCTKTALHITYQCPT
jgi:hypothetical protein